MSATEKTLYLGIGDLIISEQEAVISTVLGSCISVCLFSKNTKTGGMIHYAHPKQMSKFGQDEDLRYGKVAIPRLIQEMERLTNEPAKNFVAKVVGGAFEQDEIQKSFNIGAENFQMAVETLQQFQIPIVGECIGGNRGRKVLFHTYTNRLQVARLNASKVRDHAQNVGSRSNSLKISDVTRPIKKVRVLVVDDSKTVRDILKHILESDHDLEVVGFATNASDATEMIQTVRPDVITLDIHMPGMSGVQWLEKHLPVHRIPVVMISSLDFREGNEVFRALELGAVDYIKKPSMSEIEVIRPAICERIKAASSAKVLPTFGHSTKKSLDSLPKKNINLKKVLAIGASTGGTEALKVVLQAMPKDIPPTVIVQHIPPVFSKAFASRLNELCPFEVKEAEDGDELIPSRVLIAPGAKQMAVYQRNDRLYVRITDDPPMNRHKPSVDYLFDSVALSCGKECVGVILTGMGNDGAKGLLQIKQNGAPTIAQDEESCVVFGMPREAVRLDAASCISSLSDVAQNILTLLQK